MFSAPTVELGRVDNFADIMEHDAHANQIRAERCPEQREFGQKQLCRLANELDMTEKARGRVEVDEQFPGCFN
ncbi:MAG TPA: hypothetical protein VIK01_10800 [Polyangiaceae bacterium]